MDMLLYNHTDLRLLKESSNYPSVLNKKLQNSGSITCTLNVSSTKIKPCCFLASTGQVSMKKASTKLSCCHFWLKKLLFTIALFSSRDLKRTCLFNDCLLYLVKHFCLMGSVWMIPERKRKGEGWRRFQGLRKSFKAYEKKKRLKDDNIVLVFQILKFKT